jgi:hypothetical protein
MNDETTGEELDEEKREIDEDLDSLETKGEEMEQDLDDAEGHAEEVEVPEPAEEAGQ